MRTTATILALVLTAAAGAAGRAGAATVSVSGTAPPSNRADLAMLNTSGAVADGMLWTNGPVLGQTFTTGIWRARLYAVTFQSGTPAAATKAYTLRAGTVSGTNFTPVAAESATQTVSVSSNSYVTFTLASPLLLSSNTLYGVDVGMDSSTTNSSGGMPYLTRNGDANYAGGHAYVSGTNHAPGAAIALQSYDRVFHLDMLTADGDADGLNDAEEAAAGTNPNNPDSDGDGVGDWYEVTASYTDPANSASKPAVPYPLPDPDTAPAATNKKVKVFILSGQSNMIGYGTRDGNGAGTLQTMCLRENKFPNLVDSNGAWTVRSDVFYKGVISDTWAGALTVADSLFGPELGLGHLLGHFLNEPVLIIKTSIGNRSIGWDCLPPGSPRVDYNGNTYAGYGDSPNSWPIGGSPTPFVWYAGKQYDDFFLAESDMGAPAWMDATVYPSGCQVRRNGVIYSSKLAHTSGAASAPGSGAQWATYWDVYSIYNVTDILDNWAAEYPQWAAQGFEIAGFAWFQGNKDIGSGSPYTDRYETNLVQLIRQLRLYYLSRYPGRIRPDAPFVVATGCGDPQTNGNGLAVANAQLAINDPAKHPEFIGTARTMDIRGYWRDASISPSSAGYHYNHNAETYALVGDALGRGMLDLLSTTNTALAWDANGAGAGQTDGAGNWTDAGQWWNGSGNVSWVGGTNAVIGAGGAGGTIALVGAVSAGSLTFNAFSGTYTLGTSGSLALGWGLTVNAGAGAVAITRPVTLDGPQIWCNVTTNLLTVSGAIANGANLLTVAGNGSAAISGVIGSGAGGLTKSGTGALTLSATNTYKGVTTVSQGTLTVAAGGSLGTNSLEVMSGATCALQTSAAIADGAAVYLDGAMNLAAGVTDTVRRLYLDGAAKDPGLWNAARDPVHFSGSGSLNVLEVEIPATPAGLGAAVTNALVKLAWNPSPGATGYKVKRGLVSGGPYAALGAVTTNAWNDSAVTNGVTYYYVVSATNMGGESANSAQAIATPMPVPDAPPGLAARGSNAIVRLSWSASAWAAGYKVKRSLASGGPYAQVGAAATTNYNDAAVTNDVTYYYVVSATNTVGEGTNSAQVSAMPKATPEAPAGLTAAGSNALVRLAWSAAAGATGYRVKRASVNGGPYDPVGAAAATNYNDAAVVNDVTYYYVVAATNSAGESTNSAQAVATPSADPLLLALRQLKDHVNGVTNLNAVQIDAHKLTIDAHKARFAESTNIIAAVFDLVRAYDTKVGPLWVVHPSFSRSTQANDLDWTVYWVMQYTMDYIYKAATLAQCEALLTGFKFGSSSNFPGPCAAPPTNQTCAAAVNASFPDTFGRDTQGWTTPARRPTGAYLAPGTIVTVTVPAALVGKGYQVRVGAHSWDFSNKPTVARLDRSSLLYDITNTDTKVASPLGGGIYIEVPMLATGGVVSVTTIGAARSPFFQATSFHQTTSNEWVATERTQPGPWADYQTDKFMMQVPRSWMYNTAYPSAVMTNWDLAMDAINDLMGFPHVRGKDTMYYQVDLLMRASVYAPGYPTVNLSYNPVTDYGGNVNNYLLTGPQSVPDYVFHEQGHSYFFPKFPGETESAVNLLHVPVQNRQFGASLDDAFRGSVNYGNFHNVTNAPLDNAAVLWMTSFDFSPREVAMADWEKAYQPQGHAKFVDVARLFGWDGLNAFWYYYNSNDTYSISYPTDSDSMLLQLCKSVGRDVRPLFHFWGILPLNPTNLAAQVAAANLSAPNEIRDLLYSCKSLVPANNAAYRSWCLMWYGAPPNYNTGYGVEREHARQWDTNVLVDVSQQERFPTEIFDETASAEVKARVQEIIDLYYPPGLVWDANGTAAGRTDGAGTWTNAGRWWTGTTNQIWPAGTNAVIGVGGTGGTIALGGAVTVFHLTFSPFSGTYALATSGSLTLYGGLTLNSGAGVVIISRPVTLGAAQTWLNNSTNLLTVSGAVTNGANLLTVDGTGPTVISGAIGGGAGGLVKAGRGELTLAGSNTYSGATMVSAGTLTVAAGGRLGSGDLTVAEGATLAVQGAGAIGDSASVYLNGMLDLAAGVTETVGRLYIDGVPQPPGAWNATSDPAHFSGSGSLLVTGMDPPAAPTGLAAAGSNALVRLTWNAAANATGYRVKRALVSGGPYAPVAATAAANCDDATVTNFVTYYYVVSATNAGGESADSGEAVATPSDTPPAASFAAAALSVAEGAGTVWLTVNLSKAFICTVSLRPVVTGGTAGGADYAYAPVLLAFDPGVTSRTFGVSIVNDGEGEPAETLVFGLDSLTNATAGAPATCTVTIEEDAADWTLPFVETFEARTEGALAGQNGWQGADAVVQTNVTWSGSAKAGGMSAPAGAAWHPFGDGRTRVWTDLYVQPTFVAQPTNPPTGSSAVFYVDTNGQVVAFDGATPTPLTHAPLGQGQWVRFTVYTDYADRRWSLYLNDSPTPVAQGLRFCSDTNSGYRALAIYGSAPFDNVSITLVPPEGLPPPGRMLIFVR